MMSRGIQVFVYGYSWMSRIEISTADPVSAGVPIWLRPNFTFSVFQPTGTIFAPTIVSTAALGKKKKGGKKEIQTSSPPKSSYGSSLPPTVDLVFARRRASGGGEGDVDLRGGIAEAVGDEQERERFIGDDVELTFEDAFQI
jgi:hypothetical protein